MNLMGNLQQLGRALMLPTISLPVAAILLRLGDMPWHVIGMEQMSSILTLSGDAIFTYLPFIFAVGIALGLTENAGTAAMAALLGYFIFFQITQNYIGPHFQIGVSGGILIGLITAVSYHRFKNIVLPEYIQFFGGPRFIPLFIGLSSILLSCLMIVVGPFLQNGLIRFGELLLGLGSFGTFVYGVIFRLLVPSGLHHILNNFFWFQVGSFEKPDGSIIFGDLPRFFAGDPTAGTYMAGLYPIMMFALPAIALAIIHVSREDLKPRIRGIFLTAALASFLTGVTEPIEFAFLFVSPYLFIIHAFLSGTSMWLANVLQIHSGFSFSAGAIDFLINEHLATRGWLLIPIGLGYGLLYYVLFRWAIHRFNIPTPGREEGSILEEWAGDIPYRSPLILQALGGKQNIKKMEACITRLRLTLDNDRLIDNASLRQLGAAGIIRLGGGNVQVVFGTYSELIREEIMKLLRKDTERLFFSSPVQGRMIPLDEVPDPIFASQMVGRGVAFFPERGELVAPIAGKITLVYPSMHALGIVSSEGVEVLLHIGIDTSNLPGKWFTSVVKEGDAVQQGQLLIRFNLQKVKKHSKSLATPMVITNPEKIKTWGFAPFKTVKKGQSSVMSVTLINDPDTGGDNSDV